MTAKTYASAETAALSRPGAGFTFERGVLTAPDGRVWDYRPFGQSVAARRGRVERRFKVANAWKVRAGLWSKKELRANARLHAQLGATVGNTYGAKYLCRTTDGGTVVGLNPA